MLLDQVMPLGGFVGGHCMGGYFSPAQREELEWKTCLPRPRMKWLALDGIAAKTA